MWPGAAGADAAQRGMPGRRRVLVVDDNRALAEDLGDILETEGYEPIVSDSPLDALERAAGLDIDAAILDLTMPDIDGVELTARLTTTHPKAVYVIISGFASERAESDAKAAGAHAVLPKPVPLEQLFRILATRRG